MSIVSKTMDKPHTATVANGKNPSTNRAQKNGDTPLNLLKPLDHFAPRHLGPREQNIGGRVLAYV